MANPYQGQSADPNVPGIIGVNTAGGDGVSGTGRRGVVGESDEFQGVYGKSIKNAGVVGESAQFHAVFGISHDLHNGGVFGANDAGGFGVIGTCDSNIGVAGDSKTGSGVRGTSQSGRGVEGWSETNYGVTGDSQTFPGVRGTSANGRGVEGWSTNNDGVWGITTGNAQNAAGVHGAGKEHSIGVTGESVSGRGVVRFSDSGQGVYGRSKTEAGVVGESDQSIGVWGISHNPGRAGVVGHNPGGLAGYFEGNVEVTGDITLTGADCAEEFDVSEATDIEPGTVMVLDQEGALQPSQQAYDKRVAGVISGAGNYKPGIVLDKQSSEHRMPVALVGKVYCRVDAQYASIEVGDLLTTSDTPGHAMRADDLFKAFGSVIGKALRPLQAGQGMIPILIALQ